MDYIYNDFVDSYFLSTKNIFSLNQYVFRRAKKKKDNLKKKEKKNKKRKHNIQKDVMIDALLSVKVVVFRTWFVSFYTI